MAFFRDFSGEPVNHKAIDEKNGSHVVNRAHNQTEMDLNSSKNDFEIKIDGHYQSNGEPDTNTLENEVAVNGGTEMGLSTSQVAYERRTGGLAGQWGSNFWKACQPMHSSDVSESGHESRSGSEYRNNEGSEGNSSGGDDGVGLEGYGQKEAERVSADDLLSDEYYEQDGDEQYDFLQSRGLYPVSCNVKSQSRTVVTTNTVPRNKRRAYDDEDYEEEEDDDEADEDDRADADFDPDSRVAGVHSRDKDEEWEAVDTDEDVESEGELDMSDDDDTYYKKKSKGSQRGNTGRNSKCGRGQRTVAAPTQRRKGRVLDDEFSADDLEEDSDDDFRTRRGANLLRNSNVGQKNETRTSSRAVRKVSYAESDDSEEIDGGKNKKSQKEEVEEEHGDTIERVLWHQPKGMAEEAMRTNKSTQPVLLSHLFDTEPNWNEVEFLIKWKGLSHLHCQWKPLIELQNLSGFKKVLNYMKKVAKDIRFRKSVSREEIEVHDVSKEMDLDLFKQNCQVERVIADRINKDNFGNVTPEYLVKWQGLSYAEATWEKDVDIAFAQDAIDEYKAREVALLVQGKTVDTQRKKSKGSLRKLDEQPEWLKGGKLRDYQLEGLNFLVNSWKNDTNVILADEMGLGKTD